MFFAFKKNYPSQTNRNMKETNEQNTRLNDPVQKIKCMKKSLEKFCHESIQNHVRNRFPMSLCK